ncbi:MAG: SpoIIE family protein phosphatase [Pseudomonadota bacterium]
MADTPLRSPFTPAPPDLTEAEGLRLILVVDDSRAQRFALRKILERMGYGVVEAESGQDALEIAEHHPVDLVISDWMMPGMTGIDLCQAFRGMDRESYCYFILLTSKSERADVQAAFESGADDFLTKPIDAHELGARLNAGDRIIRMEREMARKNTLLTGLVDEMQRLSDSLDRDLEEARALQQSLVPQRFFRLDGAEISLLLRPAGKVGGDLVGVLPISATRIGIYSIDISGHGIASALMTARIAGLLSSPSPERNLALEEGPGGELQMRHPIDICRVLNEHLIEEMEAEHYLTTMIGECDLETGRVRLAQAGHPPGIVMSATGAVRFFGDGGMPVGLLPDAVYATIELQLEPGDRLFLFSDGLDECRGAAGGFLETEGLGELLAQSRLLNGEEFLEALVWDVYRFAGGTSLDDDVSGVMFDYKPEARAR